MPAPTTKAGRSSRPTKAKAKKAKTVTARALLKAVAQVQDRLDLDYAVLTGALCEVIAGHQPTARKAVVRIEQLLAQAGIR